MSLEGSPAGFAECQACDAPATRAGKYEGKPVVLCAYHHALLGKHPNFVEAFQERARKEAQKK